VSDDWSNYVADAGSDPVALGGATDAMGDAITDAQPVLESIDTSALPEEVAAAVIDAQGDATAAASWDNWSQADLTNAASWQNQAADDITYAQQLANGGDLDGAQAWLGHAATDSSIGDTAAGEAQTDLGIGAGYMDTASADLSSIDTSSYDTSSYDTSSSIDTGSVDTSSDAEA
jgi:hypothetical protein